MDKIFEIKLNKVKLDLEKNRFHVESVKNKFGTWNLFLHVFYASPQNVNTNFIHATLSLKSSQSVEKSFASVAISAKSKRSWSQNPRLAYHDINLYNFKYFPKKQIISFNFDIGDGTKDTIFTIDAINLPYDSPQRSLQDQEFDFENDKYADVTIKTKGGWEIRAHKWILSRSKTFQIILDNMETQVFFNRVIAVEDVDYDLMREFLRFIYCNTVPKLNEMAKDLFLLALRHEIPELVNICGFHLIKTKDVERIADILIAANNMKMIELKKKAVQFAAENRSQFKTTEGWKKLKETIPRLAFEVAEMF